MIPLTLRELAGACGAASGPGPEWDQLITTISSDTRTLQSHSLFVALKGENFDGHDFLTKAAESGAAAAVVSNTGEGKTARFEPVFIAGPQPGPPTPNFGGESLGAMNTGSLAPTCNTLPESAPLLLLKVPDTLIALGQLARHVREVSGVAIIGITGSVGKTTVKEMTARVLESRFSTLKSEANQNNEIGVPLTLLRLEKEHGAAVIEMGMRGPGEIRYLSEVAQPDVALITNIGLAHIGRLGSREAIADAKAEIFVGLKHGGRSILNRDDDYFERLARQTGEVISFGLHPQADVKASQVEDRGFDGARFLCSGGDDATEVALQIGGAHLIVDALAALAAGLSLGVSLRAGAEALHSFTPPAGRGEVIHMDDGVRIINDAYNATPHSVEAALALLQSMPAEIRKIAVLGDMLEMGDHAEAGHRRVGEAAGRSSLLRLICVGPESKEMQQEARRMGTSDVRWYPDSGAAAADAALWSADSDVILVKGSNGTRMNVIVQALIRCHQP